MESRSLYSGPTLAWTRGAAGKPPDNAARVHMLTRTFTNRNVVVWLSGCEVIHASHEDVVYGRGNHLKHHPGNVRLTELTYMFMTEYHVSSATVRHEIVEKLTKKVLNEGRRFLKLTRCKRNANIWYWVEESKHQAKIGQKLRDTYRTWASKSSGGAGLQPEPVQHPLMTGNNSTMTAQGDPHFQTNPASDNAALEFHSHSVAEAHNQVAEGSVADHTAASHLDNIMRFEIASEARERINSSATFYPIGTVSAPGLNNGSTRHTTEAQVFGESALGALMVLTSNTGNNAVHGSSQDRNSTSCPKHDLKPPPSELRQSHHRAGGMELPSTLHPADLLSGLHTVSSSLNDRSTSGAPCERMRHHHQNQTAMEPDAASTAPQGVLPDIDLAPQSPISATRLQTAGSKFASTSPPLGVTDALETAFETCSTDDLYAFLSMDHHHDK